MASIAMEFRLQKQWEAELAEIRAEIKCEMENLQGDLTSSPP